MTKTSLKTNRRSPFGPTGVCLLLVTTLLVAAGCGGGGGTSLPTSLPGDTAGIPASGRGQVRFTIRWPEKTSTRLIPQVTKSLKFRCLDADDEDEVISEKVVTRANSVVSLDLPSVKVRIVAEAFASEDGSGAALARGAVTVTVTEAQVTSEKLTLDSVIKEVRLSRDTLTLQPDSPLAVSANAYDETGAVVLTDPEGWEWTPDDPNAGAIVDYRPTGYLLSLVARGTGTAAFTVREKETGKTARLTVTSQGTGSQDPGPVVGQTGLEVYPNPIVLKAGEPMWPQVYYRDNYGNRTPIRGQVYLMGGVDAVSHGDGTGAFDLMGMYAGSWTLRFHTGYNFPIDVPVTVVGQILRVSVPEPGNRVEVSIDGRAIVTAGQDGNTLGRILEPWYPATYGFPLELSPGEHTIKVRNVTPGMDDPDARVNVGVTVIGAGGISVLLEKDEVYEKKILVPG